MRSVPYQASGPRLTVAPARQFLTYVWGIIAHPVRTIDRLATERSVRWAVILASLSVAQVWGNMALFALFGFNWLGTKPLLADPTYVGGFGYVHVNVDRWLPIFAALMPVLALLSLVVIPGLAQILCKVWSGRGTFEQMVNVLTFAFAPSVFIGWLSEWLTGVPMNLISGHPYWFVAAMQGEFGPTPATIWNIYASAIYSVPWAWAVVLGAMGIRRIQQIPAWAAAVVMLAAFALWLGIEATFVR